MRYIISSLFAAAALFCSSPFATAVTIYGTAYIGGGPATLYTIDPTTGIATPVGTGIGYDRVGAIDFDPITGILYGIGSNTPNTFSLITINTTTGLGTTVGDGVPNFQDINFRSDGTLFGLGGANIWTLNLTDGTPTLVGFTGFQGNGNALAFDPSDTLYRISNADIYTISQIDGNATDTGTDVQYPIDIGTNPRANAMDYDFNTGTLYASVVHSDERGVPTNFIAEIDLATGAVSNPKLTIAGLDGLAVLPEQMETPPPNGVPDPMSTLWLGLVLIGLFAFRRFEAQKVSKLLIESRVRRI
ncbi:MAG TPA: hypothetical protein VGM62_14435 [Chthoniobacterales bacterium]|jgi:hypothetical protein